MNITTSERRLAENEMVFRRYNETVQDGINTINALAVDDGSGLFGLDGDAPLHFYCECSDENCVERIRISPNEYNKIHENRSAFTIVPGHNVVAIEDVVKTRENYVIVIKHFTPPETDATLHATDIDNS